MDMLGEEVDDGGKLQGRKEGGRKGGRKGGREGFAV